MEALNYILPATVGIGLAAACGFRVFVPLLAASLFAKAEVLPLSESFAWLGSWPAIISFAAATMVEIAGYYIPWIDNALDAMAAPLAVGAGVLSSVSVMADLPPEYAWSLGIIGGGGAAGAVHAGTATVRGLSTATSGGFFNWIVSTGEWFAAAFLSVVAIVLPIIAILLTAAFIVVAVVMIRSLRKTVAGEAEEDPVEA